MAEPTRPAVNAAHHAVNPATGERNRPAAGPDDRPTALSPGGRGARPPLARVEGAGGQGGDPSEYPDGSHGPAGDPSLVPRRPPRGEERLRAHRRRGARSAPVTTPVGAHADTGRCQWSEPAAIDEPAALDGAEPGVDPHATEQPAALRAPEGPSGGLRRDTIVTTAVGLGTYGLSLFTGPLLARGLGSAGRGTYAAVWTSTQIVGWLLMFGIPGSTAFFARQYTRRKLEMTGWLFTLVVGVPIVAVLWPLVPRFLAQHPPSTVGWFRAFLVATLLVLPMHNTFEYLRATRANVRFNVYRSLPFVLTTVLIVGLFVVGRLDLTSALAVTWLANVVSPLLVLGIERSHPRLEAGLVDRELIGKQASYGARSWIGVLSGMVLARFDQFLMVGIVSPSQLGLYAVAVTAAGLSGPIAQGVSLALFPHLQREHDVRARRARTWKATIWVGLGSIVVCLGLAGLGPWALPLLMGEEFRDAIAVFWVLLPGQVFWNLGQVFKTSLEVDDRPGAASKTLIVAAVVTVVGVPLGVPLLGIMGAAIVTVLSQAVFCIGSFVLVWRGGRGDLAAVPLR